MTGPITGWPDEVRDKLMGVFKEWTPFGRREAKDETGA